MTDEKEALITNAVLNFQRRLDAIEADLKAMHESEMRSLKEEIVRLQETLRRTAVTS